MRISAEMARYGQSGAQEQPRMRTVAASNTMEKPTRKRYRAAARPRQMDGMCPSGVSSRLMSQRASQESANEVKQTPSAPSRSRPDHPNLRVSQRSRKKMA